MSQRKQPPKKRSATHPSGISDKVVRLLKIYTMIAQKKYPSINRLCEEFEVSERTIFRYLEIINLIDSIEFDKDKEGYRFLQGDRIKKLTLPEDQLLMLLAVGETVAHLGSSLKDSFQRFIENLTDISKAPAKKKAPVMIKIADAVDEEKVSAYFKTISSCIEEHRSVDMRYHTQHSGEVKERRVDPNGLVFYEGIWILIGYCHLREKLLHFALDRIVDLKETNLIFKETDGFSLEDHLSHSWGVYHEKDVTMTVRFDPAATEYILKRKKWHPSEERKILLTGEVELTFTVAGFQEIKRWLYRWVPHVKVLSPEWVRDEIRKELAASLNDHT